jgi:hypothetical protein
MAIEFQIVDINSKTLIEALNKSKANEVVLITSDNKCLIINGTAKPYAGITAAQARKLVK